jgi:hypothetical protein
MDRLCAWEGVAADVLAETGCEEPPVDGFELADLCGFEVRHGRTRRDGNVIYIDTGARRTRQHGSIAHELGHAMLVRGGEDNTEDGARYLAGALLVPRRHFDRQLRTTWDLSRLQAVHVNASAELLARRIVSLRDATAAIFDHGKLKTRIVSPWLPERFQRLTAWERELAARTLETGETTTGDERCFAMPVFDGAWRRVIVVCEAEQLALRL